MSYTRTIGNLTVCIICESNPEEFYDNYHEDIEKKIIADGYTPKTSMENLLTMLILSFDCDDNYGEYDESTGYGGYIRTLDSFYEYIEDHGGYSEFDYYC